MNIDVTQGGTVSVSKSDKTMGQCFFVFSGELRLHHVPRVRQHAGCVVGVLRNWLTHTGANAVVGGHESVAEMLRQIHTLA